MVVQTTRPKENKIVNVIYETLRNYTRSLILLRVESTTQNILITLPVTLLINLLTALAPLKMKVCFYALFVPIFCALNGGLLLLTEGSLLEEQEEETKDSKKNQIISYSYTTLLGLSYLPLYILTIKLSKFLKPVALIVFLGVYSIFFLNNSNKGPLTPVTNTIAIFVFVYLCIDNIT